MATPPPLLDHLVLATPDLAATVADFTRRTGVAPAPGGAHVGLGTRNFLVGLGGSAYLEIVGPDPEQPEPARPRPFGIDRLAAPAVVTWAIRPPDLDATVAAALAAGAGVGPVRAMSRRRPDGTLLEWRLTLDESAGVVPFLIDWGATAHPSAGLPAVGLRSVAASAPDSAEVRRVLVALGTDLDVVEGRTGLTVRLDTPAGVLDLP
ncbi:VOC family protein [Streptomyces sp. NPDC046716]|uniref:VOC family protein n=1 Tax=Streptomyces sp. NPDC046716 TaxID=3157093 RepID=UPI0033F05578